MGGIGARKGATGGNITRTISTSISNNKNVLPGNLAYYFTFYQQSYEDMISEFTSKVPQAIQDQLKYYAYGVYGDETQKDQWDRANKISEYIDSSNLKLKNATLYRGVVLTDAELAALKVGQDSNIKGITSWSDREMVSHMYAVGDPTTGETMGNKKGHPVIFIDEKTNDALPVPYTYPQNEGIRSRNMKYKVVKIQTESQYTAPIGREPTGANNDYFTEPVTYVWVKHSRRKKN